MQLSKELLLPENVNLNSASIIAYLIKKDNQISIYIAVNLTKIEHSCFLYMKTIRNQHFQITRIIIINIYCYIIYYNFSK